MPAQEAQKETIYGQCVTPVLHSQHLVASKTSVGNIPPRFSGFMW